MTTTSRPFERVKWVIGGPLAVAVATAPASAVAAKASAATVVRGLSKSAVSPDSSMARNVAGGSAAAHAAGVGMERKRRRRRWAAILPPSAFGSCSALFNCQRLALLILRAQPIRLVRRWRLIAGRRGGQVVPHRLAGERRGFR